MQADQGAGAGVIRKWEAGCRRKQGRTAVLKGSDMILLLREWDEDRPSRNGYRRNCQNLGALTVGVARPFTLKAAGA